MQSVYSLSENVELTGSQCLGVFYNKEASTKVLRSFKRSSYLFIILLEDELDSQILFMRNFKIHLYSLLLLLLLLNNRNMSPS